MAPRVGSPSLKGLQPPQTQQPVCKGQFQSSEENLLTATKARLRPGTEEPCRIHSPGPAWSVRQHEVPRAARTGFPGWHFVTCRCLVTVSLAPTAADSRPVSCQWADGLLLVQQWRVETSERPAGRGCYSV